MLLFLNKTVNISCGFPGKRKLKDKAKRFNKNTSNSADSVRWMGLVMAGALRDTRFSSRSSREFEWFPVSRNAPRGERPWAWSLVFHVLPFVVYVITNIYMQMFLIGIIVPLEARYR